MTYVEEPLFVEIGPKMNPVTAKPYTLGQRQQARIDAGMHPLSGVGAMPRLIRLAPSGTGTCGSCKHLARVGLPVGDGYRTKTFSKCTFAADRDERGRVTFAPRISNSTGTDCRRKWPACTDYQPRDDGRAA
ncbi:hypothetical protein [Glycomyces sp. NPDC021274]|uniref:hypothetical protein n=1 Tax=Glycomyces sp. NPDC021274 TaxID=3155120 RepID=UPI0033F7D505